MWLIDDFVGNRVFNYLYVFFVGFGDEPASTLTSRF